MSARDRFLTSIYLSIRERAGIPPTEQAREESLRGLALTTTTRPAHSTPDRTDPRSVCTFDRPESHRNRHTKTKTKR